MVARERFHGAQKLRNFAPSYDGFRGIAPVLIAFLFPFGAPVEGPPCTRQRPFFIAGDLHGLPLWVRARHRRARCSA